MHETASEHPFSPVSNLFPACAPCNIDKHSLTPEYWREVIQRRCQILSRDSATYRSARRFGLIRETSAIVEFYFEKTAAITQKEAKEKADASQLKSGNIRTAIRSCVCGVLRAKIGLELTRRLRATERTPTWQLKCCTWHSEISRIWRATPLTP